MTMIIHDYWCQTCNMYKIYNNPGRLIVSERSCPTELTSSYLDKVMTPLVKSLPSYIKDSNHALEIIRNFNVSSKSKIIFTMGITSLYIVMPTMKASKHSNTF